MDEFAEIRRRLLKQSYLFDEPNTYEAGVEDALDAVRRAAGRLPYTGRSVIDLTDASREHAPA